MMNKKMNLTATYTYSYEGVEKTEEIDLSDVMVTMEYDGATAEVDAETAIKRSLHLVYENQILRQAVQEAKNVFEAHNKSKIILPENQ